MEVQIAGASSLQALSGKPDPFRCLPKLPDLRFLDASRRIASSFPSASFPSRLRDPLSSRPSLQASIPMPVCCVSLLRA